GLQRRSAERREDGAIPAAERSFRASFAHGAWRPAQRLGSLAVEERAQPRGRALLLAELRAHRAMHARYTRSPPQLVQHRRVAVADDGLRHHVSRDGRREAPETGATVSSPEG